MMQRAFVILVAALALAGCFSGKPKVRINPPTVSIQEIRIDGMQCIVLLRLQNHSTVSMRYSAIDFERLAIDGRELGPLALTPDLDVAPYTGEPFAHTVHCPDMTPGASELTYRLSGRISAVEPGNRRFDFSHRSRLLPVPGLTGVYR